ncbi:carbohydrate ABC transporter permease [Microbacterium lushaniae]|uniref:Sugar ABC transporter permease n=1 Tax=Microbacterium lushaniae TaxID=2614639 RepID=A0A5J6L6F6_9MICO|nr:sugar ABC transporter permease [Microbacterium lushaniae]QEW04249.1 sugar ABC transporter permease [Microbacterium lushaniae]
MASPSQAAASARDVGAAAPTSRRRAAAPPTRGKRRLTATVAAYVLVLPAALFYIAFVISPIVRTAQYSLYEWDGISPATWAGLANYVQVFANPTLVGSILNSFELILYFSVVPVILGLFAANVIRGIATSRLATVARTVLFLPQVIPLVAAGIMWTWQLSTKGVVNQFLELVGLGAVARAWLGDTQTALPAVGVIGAWVQLGLCLLLLLAGMTKIDPALYEAARIDGAGPVREFFSITLPSVRQELAVCVTITVISALASFDIIYISTQGGPANSTLVPGLQIYYLAFFQRDIGTASALAMVLMVLVLLVVIPLQRVLRGRDA